MRENHQTVDYYVIVNTSPKCHCAAK